MLTTSGPVTADNLNSVVEFDCPFTVHPDGTVTDGPDSLYAPELTDGEIDGDGWEFVDGYSGQHGYRGPIMHDSEFLGGGMARDVLATPGTYVVVAAQYLCTDTEHANGDPVTDDDPRATYADAAGTVHTYVSHDACESYWEGWALLRRTDCSHDGERVGESCGYCSETVPAPFPPLAADASPSWGEVADRSAAGLCPASHGYSEPHIVTDGASCDECGATV